MEHKTDQNSLAGLNQATAGTMLEKIQEASKAFQIVSLNRQIDACQSLFSENPSNIE